MATGTALARYRIGFLGEFARWAVTADTILSAMGRCHHKCAGLALGPWAALAVGRQRRRRALVEAVRALTTDLAAAAMEVELVPVAVHSRVCVALV